MSWFLEICKQSTWSDASEEDNTATISDSLLHVSGIALISTLRSYHWTSMNGRLHTKVGAKLTPRNKISKTTSLADKKKMLWKSAAKLNTISEEGSSALSSFVPVVCSRFMCMLHPVGLTNIDTSWAIDYTYNITKISISSTGKKEDTKERRPQLWWR